MNKRMAALCAGVMLLFSSCTGLPAGPEDLLEAPRLNTRQAEMYSALEGAVNLADILYRYTRSGNYRSPFVFWDLDGDGLQEAIVFYAYNDRPQDTRATVFKEGEDGGWQMIYDIPGGGDQVDFIRFASLLDQDQPCLLVGWQNTGFGVKQLGVYSFTEDSFRQEYIGAYTQYVTGVFDSTGLAQVVLAQQVERSRAELVILGRGTGGRLQELDRIQTAAGVQEVLQLQVGGGASLYVDELWAGNDVYTEIFGITQDSLFPIAAQQGGEDFTSTLRQYRTDDHLFLSGDVGRNGDINIPVLYPLPAVEENTELTPLMLTGLLYMTPEGFEVDYAVINPGDGYLVYFPEKWIDTVTVVRQPEFREWRFYTIDPDTGGTASELLRVRVHDNRDYKDQFISDYMLLAQSGVLEYYAYIPRTSDESLAVTEDEARELFLLL